MDTTFRELSAGGPVDPAADPALDDGAAELGQLISLEETAARLLLTRDGAYRLLRRHRLPYLLVRSESPTRHMSRRVAVTRATFRYMLAIRARGVRLRGPWTAAALAELGLTPEGLFL